MDTPIDTLVNNELNKYYYLDTCMEILNNYIMKYPEDSVKWLEYIEDIQNPCKSLSSIYPSDEFIEGIKVPIKLEDEDIVITDENIRCPYCKNTFASDTTIPTMTLLCGHVYHTICFNLIEHYNDQRLRCLLPDCRIDMHTCIYRIVKKKRKVIDKIQDVFLQSQMQRKDFKKDVIILKKQITSINKIHNRLKNKEKDIRKKIIHKHINEIREIQKDINNGSSELITSSDEYKECKKTITVYRKKASAIFRKYHISLRDMINEKKIKISWRLRSILERHGQITSKYRFGIRIYPRTTLWKDPIP